jgi:hypothetical protein
MSEVSEGASEPNLRALSEDAGRERAASSTGSGSNAAETPINGLGPRDTWGANLPAMRVSPVEHLDAGPHGSGARRSKREAPHYVRTAPSPPTLRTLRALAGIALLLVAWAATVGVILLVQMLLGGPPSGYGLAVRFTLYGLAALGALWLAVTAIASLVTGAFALSLAFSARGW